MGLLRLRGASAGDEAGWPNYLGLEEGWMYALLLAQPGSPRLDEMMQKGNMFIPHR